LTILSAINPKTVVDNLVRLHENHLGTFHAILDTDRQRYKWTNIDNYITSLSEVKTEKHKIKKIVYTLYTVIQINAKKHNSYSHNGEGIRVSNTTWSNEKRGLGSTLQQTLGLRAVASYHPRLLIEMWDGSSIRSTSQTTTTALYQVVKTLVTFTSV